MATITPLDGAVPVTLDRPRQLLFDHLATFALLQRYGKRFASQLYKGTLAGKNIEFELVSMDAMVFFLWAGLQVDAKQQDAPITEAEVARHITPRTHERLFNAVIDALIGNTTPPAMPGAGSGKAEATGTAAVSAAKKPAARKTKGPGPTALSGMSTRNASPTGSSAGRPPSSGPRRRTTSR